MKKRVDLDLELPVFVQPPEEPTRLDPESVRKRDAWRQRNRMALGPRKPIDPREIPTVPFEWKD
jgi:hypothetical protein